MRFRYLAWVVVFTGLLGSLLVSAGCQRVQVPSEETVPLRTTYITPEFHAALVIKVQRLLDSSLAAELKTNAGDRYLEELLQQLNLRYHVRFQDLARYTMLATSIAETGNDASEIANILQYHSAVDTKSVNQQLIGESRPAQVGSRNYLRGLSPGTDSLYWLEQKTVVRAPERHVKQLITSTSVNQPLAELIEESSATHDAVLAFTIQSLHPDTIRQLRATSSESPLHPFIPAIGHLESVVLSLSLAETRNLEIKLAGHNANSATALAALATRALVSLKQQLDTSIEQLTRDTPGSSQLMAFQLARNVLDLVTLKVDENVVILEAHLTTKHVSELAEAIGVNVLRSTQERFRVLTRSRLDQIGSSILQFHETHGSLPVGNQSPLVYRDGQPLLSWRVHLLPFLQEEKLYRQFHLDEPWNSKHNLPLVKQIPHVYTSPQHGSLKGHTTYLAPGGPGTVLGENKPIRFDDITDGIGQTILVVQVGPDQAIEWTRPVDLLFSEQDSLEQVGQVGNYLSALFADGRVFHLDPRMPPRVLRALFQYQDGIRLDRRRLRR